MAGGKSNGLTRLFTFAVSSNDQRDAKCRGSIRRKDWRKDWEERLGPHQAISVLDHGPVLDLGPVRTNKPLHVHASCLQKFDKRLYYCTTICKSKSPLQDVDG